MTARYALMVRRTPPSLLGMAMAGALASTASGRLYYY